MTGAIFTETLRRNWRQILYWGLGLGMYGMMVVLLAPNSDMLNSYAKIIQAMPSTMLQAFGGEDVTSVATPAGFFNLSFFSYALIIMAFYAAVAGMNVTANEEDAGIMDVLMSLPVPRWKLILEKFLAYVVVVVVILTLTFLCTWGVLLAVPTFGIDTGLLLAAVANLLPGTLMMLGLTVLLGAFFRRKNVAIGVASAVIVGSYFIDFIGRAASDSAAGALRVVSFFAYYDSGHVIREGLNWLNVLVLVVAAVVLLVGGMWLYQRRDIGV